MSKTQGRLDSFEDDATSGPLDRMEVLHTGDIVLLKCSLQEDPFIEASEGSTGFVTGDVIEYVPKVTPVKNFATSGLDFRDFLFAVVDQLSYRALKDLRKRKKLLAQHGGGAGTSLAVELRNLEERARREREENMQVRSQARPVRYGDVVQLQHLRTGMYVGVKAKFAAEQQATSRRVELQDGTMASWLTVTPFFSHRKQGELVTFNEMVSLESVKLSEQWNLNFFKYAEETTGEEAYEFNCMKGGRGFYFLLYSRDVPVAVKSSSYALSFGVPLRMYSPHRKGCIAASCSLEKKQPYMRSIGDENIRSKEFCAKDVWVIEPASHEFLKDTGIEYTVTPVLLRHLGSGQYLAISESDMEDKKIRYSEEGFHGRRQKRGSRKSGGEMSPVAETGPQQYQEVAAEVVQAVEETVSSELVATPTAACLFTLEMSSISMHQHEKMYISAESPCVLIKWDRAAWPFWLSCMGHQKKAKDRPSMMLEWSRTRSSRDALRLEVITDRSGMNAFDTVCYHRMEMRKLTPRILSPSMSVDRWLHELQKAERAFSEMIFFLAHSLNWQYGAEETKKKSDPLKEAWSANSQRQRFVRELKYIDETVRYFHALAGTMPEMQAEEVDFATRLKGRTTNTGSKLTGPAATKGQSSEQVDKAKARVLKVLVRLWLYCFLRNRTNENFFFTRGYMDIIDDMNGRGLGASDVFVALLSQNRELVRKVKPDTVTRFIRFIRVLGPLDTWLLFLKALCNPQNDGAISDKQQLVLSKIAFAGWYAPKADQAAVKQNRQELMINVALEGPLGVALTRSADRQVDPKECLGTALLVHGIHDVAISWAHPGTWQVGKVLYHGPEALKLPILKSTGDRKWISLAQVVWVLQPSELCETVTGQSWSKILADESGDSSDWQQAAVLGKPHKSRDAGNPFDGSRIDLLRSLARYFQAQLQLVASLAKERQMNSIMALQEEYTYSLCLSGAADPRLPSIIRASFFDLLMSLWVDRHPHYQVVAPRLMRSAQPGQAVLTLPVFRMQKEARPDQWTVEHAKNLPKEVISFYHLRNTDKLEGLVQAVCHYLTDEKVKEQVHSQEDDNKLTLAVIQTLELLIRFGFIRSFQTCVQLHTALLRVLDGRTDWLHPPEATAQLSNNDGPSQPSGFGMRLGGLFEGSPLLGGPSRNLATPQHGVRRPPTNDSARRYLKCDENQSVMNSKVSIAEALLHLRHLGLDVQISQVLAKFQEFAQNQITLAAMVDVVFQVMDRPALPFEDAVQSPSAMLIDLLMYEEPKLFPTALELLCSHCSSEFLDELLKVTLLSERQDALMQQLKSDVAQMSKILYSFENWGSQDDYAPRDTEPLNEIEEIGKRLQKACTGNAAASGMMVQDMLLHTDFVSIAGYWLMLDWQDTLAENRFLHQRLTAIVCSVATAFCRKNPKNQGVFMDFLPGLSRILGEDPFPECIGLVAEIFRGNLQNCQLVPEALVECFGDMLVRSKRAGHFVPWHTHFLSSIVSVGLQGVSRNQVLVMECLQKNKAKNLMNCGLSLDRILQLIGKFNSTEMMKHPSPDCWRQEDAELVYYASCLDLLSGLAIGRTNIVNKPFVAEIFSKIHCLALISKVPFAEDQNSPAGVVTRHLRTRWLQILQLLLYDVEPAQYELGLMCSPSHFEFLGWLLRAMEVLLVLEPLDDASSTLEPKFNRAGASFKGLDQEREEYMAAILSCVGSFFNGPFQACIAKDEFAGEQLQDIGKKYSKRFKMLERSTVRARLSPESLEFLSIATYRVVTAMGGKVDTMILQEVKHETTDGSQDSGLSEDQVLWQKFLDAVKRDERFHERRRRAEDALGKAFLTVYEETDPDYQPYLKTLSLSGASSTMDFRRHGIQVQEAIARLVHHCEANLQDLPSLRRTMRILLAIVDVSSQADWQREDLQLGKVQVVFSKAGVAKLLVKVLNEHRVKDVQHVCWNLLGELLKGSGMDGDARLNKAVQSDLHEAMSSSNDDVGMWESFHEILSHAGRTAKFVHRYRTLPVLTAVEKAQLQEFNEILEEAANVMEAVRLLVEGHFQEMQDYLYSQEGNTRSFNVPGLCCWLLTRLCKDAQGTNYASFSELKCVKSALTLLTELAQGPNLRNQEFLSNMGLIELVFKLLRVNFEQVQKSESDVYPAAARELKAELLNTLKSLLEGRRDQRIHQTVVQRGDPMVIRERIEFVYVYFMLGAVAISPGKVTRKMLTAVPLDGNLNALMLPQADPSEVYAAVSRNSALVTELLESMDDDQLQLVFSEGFALVELVLELAQHSKRFSDEVMPFPEEDETFQDSEKAYRTTRDYIRERAAFHKRQIYRQAFGMLRRFVKTIEVVLDGHLQSLHFQTPVTAVWYVQGASKQRILDEVPFSLPDVKMKSFVQMCVELNNESRLILALSRFSLVPHGYRRWAQVYLSDYVHRPFWVFLANDARHMQNLLRASLYLSLCLALHAGLFLVPTEDGGKDLVWRSAFTQRMSEIMGAVHLGCTLLWLCLYTFIKMPLNIRMVKHLYPKRNALVNIFMAWARYISQPLLAWRCLLMSLTALAYFSSHWWVYSFLLADFFCLSPSLQAVLTGVVAPARPLFMTFLGAAIITFAYGAIGMHNFRDDFDTYCDTNIMVCTSSILYMGTRAGIVGLSGMMDQVGPEDKTWLSRMFYDMSYFVIFGIMLLNTIVALIVDSFQTQRRELTAREYNLATQSFISCVKRKTIETVAQASGIIDGWEYHETICQNKWDYMAFIFNLFEKSPQNYTGPESQIRHFIDSADVTWLPIGRSKMLEGKSDENKEDTLTSIHSQNSKIIGALKQSQDNRQTLFKAIGSLARTMRDKTESVQEQLRKVLVEHSDGAKVAAPRSHHAKPTEASPVEQPAAVPVPEAEDAPMRRRRISMF